MWGRPCAPEKIWGMAAEKKAPVPEWLGPAFRENDHALNVRCVACGRGGNQEVVYNPPVGYDDEDGVPEFVATVCPKCGYCTGRYGLHGG